MTRFHRLLALMLTVLLLFLCCACQAAAPSEDEDGGDDEETDEVWDYTEGKDPAPLTGVTLNVYNWGEYIDDEVLDVNEAFTYRTGIRINYKTFENNESMYAILSSGAADYDVVFPSDYMVEKMIKEGMVKKLNFTNIPNFRYIAPAYRNLAYDPENAYSVPYTWGTIGIFYNAKYVEEADLALGWDLLWCDKYKDKILMFNNPRDAFGVAFLKLGYSLNTRSAKEWQSAFAELVRQKQVLYKYVNDEVYDLMIGETCWIAPYFSGDGAIMIYDDGGNENIRMFSPESGTNFFVDAMCVRSTTQHADEAEAYINFLCHPQVAKANAEYICYSTPHEEARKLLDPDVANNPYFYPPQTLLDRSEMYLDLDAVTNKLQADLWLKLKQTTRYRSPLR